MLTGQDTVPLISVVLPVYNGEKYLGAAIDSILAQTFSDFELILIDDGSTDGSCKILNEYQKRDARLRVFSRENRGLVATLNEGIDFSRGSWIARMDQDDIALPHRFERQLAWLANTGADMAGSWVQRFGTSDRRVVRLHQTDQVIKMELIFGSPFVHPSVMMRAALVRQLHYDSACEKAEDYDLWARAAEACWKMTNVPEVLLLYRIHPEQISTRTATRQKQVGQDIRLRYLEFTACSLDLGREQIEEVLKVFEPSSPALDMDVVDAFFLSLLRKTQGESRDVAFNHITRLYIKVAADCSNIVARWDKLNSEFGHGAGTRIRLGLRLFRMLRIRPEGALFRRLRKMYVWGLSQ